MGTFADKEEAAAFFTGDRVAADLGAELISLTEDSCLCRMVIDGRHKNAMGGVMGGAIFTLADFAFAVVCNQAHLPTVAQTVTIQYLNGVREGTLLAIAQIIKSGRSTTVAQVRVVDQNDRDVALFLGTGF